MSETTGKAMLPYCGGAEDVEKVVQFLRSRPTGASEGDLKRTLGPKFADSRKFDLYEAVGLFKRQGGVFRLTDSGTRYLRADDERKKMLIQEAIKGFAPYHSIIEWAYHNNIQTLDADSVKHEWASKFEETIDLTNRSRLEGAPVTLFSLLQAAGLGTFVIGRRGAKSRIEFSRRSLEEYVGAIPLTSKLDISADATAEIVRVKPIPKQEEVESSKHTFIIPVFGKVAKLTWSEPTMTAQEWEKLKKVGDAMFLD